MQCIYCNGFVTFNYIYIGHSHHHQSLLIEPILLPEDLSHLNVDKQTDISEPDSCFFYPSGMKNVNIKHVIDKVTKDKMEELAAKDLKKSNSTNNANKSKKTRSTTATNSAANRTNTNTHNVGTGSIGSAPRTRQPLYHCRQPDLKTANLLNTLRFNEAKIVGLISTTT